MKKIIFLTLLTFSYSSFAQDYLDSDIYKQLTRDFIHELDEYDDVRMTEAQKRKISKDFQLYLDGKGVNPLTQSHDFIPEYIRLEAYEASSTVPEVEVKKLKKLKITQEAHSIEQMDDYLKNRLGSELYDLSNSGKVDVVVHAGDRRHLLDAVGDRSKKLVKIPSFYEQWSIHKYVDVNSLSGKPVVYINIPPISEYAEHYRNMLSHSKGNIEVILNETDRTQLKTKYKKAVDFVIDGLNIPKQSYFAIGYVNQIEQGLKSSAKWTILNSRVIDGTGEIGIVGKVFEVQSKLDASVRTTIVSVGAKSTLWGEASSFLTDGILGHNPKGVYFMGSAGSLSQSHNVYDISVAEKFISGSDFSESGVKNIVYQHNQFNSIGQNVESKVNWGGTHGNSYSPSEQTESFLKQAQRKSISTLDVEQSLIAKTIAAHNKNGANVVFGAVNIVTDKPSVKIDAGADLDRVDSALKQKSRLSAVELTLETIHEQDHYLANSDDARKKLIMKALPNIPEENIKIKNGMGRVDSNKNFKMSYYIRTINPQDPMSKVQLIPMATSRYDRYNYNTDEWWDKYGEARMRGEKVPHEDADQVAKFLRDNNLSTNPDVHVLQANAKPKTTKLKDFLLDRYLEMYGDGKDVILYRGIGKMEELNVWRSGITPRGVRYWTPNANYAWRYARKRENFITNLITDNTPIVKFKIPKNEFIQMVNRNEVVLGTELPKSAHRIFDSSGEFGDSLYGSSYLGDGKLGVEHEIRFRRRGREKIAQYFVGAVDPTDLGRERILTLKEGYARLVDAKPAESQKLIQEMNERIGRVQAEMEVLGMMDQDFPHERVVDKFNTLSGTDELINNDFERLSTVIDKYKETSTCFGAYNFTKVFKP